MPALGINSTWGREDFSAVLIEGLRQESALLRAGATLIVVQGRNASIPRILVDPDADWVAELAELPSDPGDADVLTLTPRKIGSIVNLSTESIEDAPLNELDAVGRSMVRGVASKLDVRAFSNLASTAIAPAGLRSVETALPTATVTEISVESLIQGVGTLRGLGARPDVVFIATQDLTALELAATSSAYNGAMSIEGPAIASISGARLIGTPAMPAGVALIAEARYLVIGVRRDIAVDFSEHSSFSSHAVAARATGRLDLAVSDPAATLLLV